MATVACGMPVQLTCAKAVLDAPIAAVVASPLRRSFFFAPCIMMIWQGLLVQVIS
jgi:hypothetical protein